jgi:hypothetical protein
MGGVSCLRQRRREAQDESSDAPDLQNRAGCLLLGCVAAHHAFSSFLYMRQVLVL